MGAEKETERKQRRQDKADRRGREEEAGGLKAASGAKYLNSYENIKNR